MINYRIVLSMLIGLLSACGEPDIPADPMSPAPPTTVTSKATALTQEMSTLQAQIAVEVGIPAATDVAQCGALAAGAKACGGPTHYIVYSRAVSDEARLRELVERYTQAERQLNQVEGRMSDCAMVLAPVVALVDGVCRAN